MLACFENAVEVHETPIALHEVAVHLGGKAALFQQAGTVDRAVLAVPGQPSQRIGIELVARITAVPLAANLLDDAVALERKKQEPDDFIGLRAPEALGRREVRRDRTPHVLPVGAVGRYEVAVPFVLLSRARPGDDGANQLPLVFQVPDRTFEEPRFRLLDEIVLSPRIEDIDLHGKLSPDDIEEGPDDVLPQIGGGETKRGRSFDKAFLAAALTDGKPGLPQLFLREQAVAPVEPSYSNRSNPQSSRLGAVTRQPRSRSRYRKYSSTRRKASRVLCLAGPRTSGSAAKSSYRGFNGIEDGAGEVAVTDPGWQGALARPMQCRAQQGDLCKVVEVTRLQGGVLAVVGEAEELSRHWAQIPVALHLDERAQREDRGGGASVVDPKRRQLEAFGPLASRVGDPAGRLQAEQEVAADEGGRCSRALRDHPPVGDYEDGAGKVLAGVRANPLHAPITWAPITWAPITWAPIIWAPFIGFLEGVRQAFEELRPESMGPRRFLGEMEVPVLTVVAVELAAVLARKQHYPLFLHDDPHAVVLGPATAAEHEREKGFVRFARFGRLLGDLQVTVRPGSSDAQTVSPRERN